ncbi:acyltransferase domain-containing protein [Streptomyces sp. NPDC056149]|uniref:acyltransferase domain-containing protein n=1 Tax=Streptomyces sp. NPDC056149 TaxID=3345728 RepID=UPI0035D82063
MRQGVPPALGKRESAALRIVHVFPGQGDFAVSPLIRALRAHPAVRHTVREVFEESEEVAREFGIAPMAKALLSDAPPSGRDLAAGPVGTPQLALFCSSMAVHRALCAAGLAPDEVLGVSFGEIAALTAAGVFEVAEGARIACLLAHQLARCPGGLTLLATGEAGSAALLRRTGSPELALACINGPDETIVSGPLPRLRALEEHAKRQDVPAARLRLPFSSHHPSLTGPADAFAAAIGPIDGRPARVPVRSAVRGGLYRPGDDVHRGLADCLIRPMRLPPVLRQVTAGGDRALFFEAGTGRALTRSIREVLPPEAAGAHAPLADPDFPWPGPDEPTPRPPHAALATRTALWSQHDDHAHATAR